MLFLDTNTCIYYLNGRSESIRSKLLATPPDEVLIPSIVKAELLFGAAKSARKKDTLEKVEAFLSPFRLADFDGAAAEHYAEIRYGAEKGGRPVGPNDLLIAVTVMSRAGVLVTHNLEEFRRIEGLQLVDWVEGSG